MSNNQTPIRIMTPEETIEALQQRGFYEGVPGEISAYSHTNTAETAEARSQQDSQALLHVSIFSQRKRLLSSREPATGVLFMLMHLWMTGLHAQGQEREGPSGGGERRV